MKYLIFISAIIFPHALSLVAFDQFVGNQNLLIAMGTMIDVAIYCVIIKYIKRK